MPREHAIECEGKVLEILSPHLLRVELPNGHRILAYPFKSGRAYFKSVQPGDRVRVEMSPYDMSKGRLRERPHNSEQDSIYESKTFGETALRKLQDHPPQRGDSCCLQQCST